jgi:hypothetical protein
LFHFIVIGAGWTPDRDTIDRGRVLEYTDDGVAETFHPGDNLDLEAVTSLPALFASETGEFGDQIARVGTITRVRLVGRNYQIDYVIDPGIVAISNAKLEEMAADLDIEPSNSIARIGRSRMSISSKYF